MKLLKLNKVVIDLLQQKLSECRLNHGERWIVFENDNWQVFDVPVATYKTNRLLYTGKNFEVALRTLFEEKTRGKSTDEKYS